MAGNISSKDGEGVIKLLKEGVDMPDDTIGRLTSTPGIPPSFNNSLIITEHFKASTRACKLGNGPDEELKANGFSPANVTRAFEGLPSKDEVPGSPSTLDSDGNAKASTCI